VAQELSDLGQRCTAAEHQSRRGVTQPVSMDPFKAASFASVANNLRYRATGESMMRSSDPCKHCAALRACRTIVMQVSRDCFADVSGQR
jgi:hypothetical protein